MKKVLISMIALAGLAGCTYYDYYKGGIRYTQDGDDCVYYADEYARNYSSDVRGMDDSKRIVYRHTRCEDLFARDNGGRVPVAPRKVLSSAAVAAPEAAPVAPAATTSCPFAKSAPVAKSSSCGCDAAPVRRVYTVTVM